MALFETGSFTLHSGEHSTWKLECDCITDEEMTVLAKLIAERVMSFSRVMAVSEDRANPSARLRSALAEYASDDTKVLLIVDDVFTTGTTMNILRNRILDINKSFNKDLEYDEIRGAVIFARTKTPDWITPLFSVAPTVRMIQ